ncbi:MAG: hypothetical protein JXO51_07400 [Candidatus Aminicenantes bacterium]|nr:hypothetical protein [Candidatus Aminicenantes bacterium]
MGKKVVLAIAGLAMLASFSPATANPWGDLKKIYFYEASGNEGEVKKCLERLDAQALPPQEKSAIAKDLSQLGDRFLRKKEFSLAELFYLKALRISPRDAWPAYNNLEAISRRRGNPFWRFTNVWRQFSLLTRSFSGSYLLLMVLFGVLMFSGLLLFFLVAAALGIRYFKLAAHDFILGGVGRFGIARLLLLLLLLLWPLLVAGGWGFYPFLLCGLLWNYFSHDERVNVKRIQVVLLVLAFLYGLGQYLESSLQSPGFQVVKKLADGHLFPESTWSHFDNEMKVMQAYAYFHRNHSNTALDILQATGASHVSTLKSNLLGSIYYEKGNIPQSIQYFRQSLSMDNRDPLTLKNFTMALLKNNDPERFLFYSKNYPVIQELKDKVTALQKDSPSEKILWERLVNYSWRRFHFWNFLKIAAGEFVRLPVLLAILVMAAYASLLKRLFPFLGQSVFCSKCAKIIKKISIEQTRSHALCDGCYQLFLIKDPIFLEAKLLKEREIGRQFRLKNSLLLFASLLVPGFVLNFKNKSKLFSPLFFLFFTVFGLFLFGTLNFKGVFGAAPMFLNLVGLTAALLYLAINLYALKGDQDGL